MYDTARRVALVKKRVRDNTRRRQRRSVYGLSAACMLLFAALVQAEGMAIERGQTTAQGAFGAILLREDAGGYVLVAVAAFAVAVVLVIACMRLHEREKRRNRSKEREKKNTPRKSTIPTVKRPQPLAAGAFHRLCAGRLRKRRCRGERRQPSRYRSGAPWG